MASDPRDVVILQLEASDPDGFGYTWGFLDEIDPLYYSAQWGAGEVPLCDESSQFATLRALSHFIARTSVVDKLLSWVSNRQSAVYTVNKGWVLLRG